MFHYPSHLLAFHSIIVVLLYRKPQSFISLRSSRERICLLYTHLYIVTFADSKLGLHDVRNLPYCNYFDLPVIMICNSDSQVYLDEAIQYSHLKLEVTLGRGLIAWWKHLTVDLYFWIYFRYLVRQYWQNIRIALIPCVHFIISAARRASAHVAAFAIKIQPLQYRCWSHSYWKQ